MKKLIKKIELLALIISLSAVATITFYLLFNYKHCMIFTEPIWWIRILEIIMGLFTIFMIIKIIRREIKMITSNEI